MVLNPVQYKAIYNKLLQKHCDFPIHELKLRFRDDINSLRDFERISKLADLLKVLEKRDVIGYDQEANLRYITNIIAPRENLFEELSNNTIADRYRVFSPPPVKQVEKIHVLVRNNIGGKWRELARKLSISEGDIDNLNEVHNRRIPEILNEILTLHQEKYANFELWRSKLQEALVAARRTDLSEKINEILSQK